MIQRIVGQTVSARIAARRHRGTPPAMATSEPSKAQRKPNAAPKW
jgi:hypothetical protein